MTKAIISPYEDTVLYGIAQNVPAVINDTGASRFDSSDVPNTVVVQPDEVIVYLDPEYHEQAVALGYTEVEI